MASDNADVRLRLILAMAVTVLLAGAALRSVDPPQLASADRQPAPSRIASEPAPDPALPALVSATMAKSASVPSQPVFWSRESATPTDQPSATATRPRVRAATATPPINFPLLI